MFIQAFAKKKEALEYCHGKKVIHRDLKVKL